MAAGAGPVRTGDLVVFCKPVAVAAAVVRRDGRVQAAGHPADHVRLGVAEERLDVLCGEPGVIDKVAAGLTLTGRVKGTARRHQRQVAQQRGDRLRVARAGHQGHQQHQPDHHSATWSSAFIIDGPLPRGGGPLRHRSRSDTRAPGGTSRS